MAFYASAGASLTTINSLRASLHEAYSAGWTDTDIFAKSLTLICGKSARHTMSVSPSLLRPVSPSLLWTPPAHLRLNLGAADANGKQRGGEASASSPGPRRGAVGGLAGARNAPDQREAASKGTGTGVSVLSSWLQPCVKALEKSSNSHALVKRLRDLDEPPVSKRGIVYGIRSPSGKMYIGQTRQTLKKRWVQHKKPSSLNPNKCWALARAIKKYGAKCMQVWAMEEDVPLDQLGAREKALIAQHGTMVPNGYNITRGGDEGPMCTPSVAAKSKATNRLPEVIARRAVIYASAPVKERLKSAGRKRWQDPEYRAMMSRARKGSKRVKEQCAKMRAMRRTPASSASKRKSPWSA